MKKVCFITVVILIFSLFFTCTLPTSIELTGNPKISFAAKLDFNKTISDNIKNGFNNVKNTILECIKTPVHTFIIHMNLFNEPIGGQLAVDLGSLSPDGNGEIVNIIDNISLIPPFSMNFTNSNINLPGFEFKKIYAKLFISGSDIVQELKINLDINGVVTSIEKPFGFEASGFNEGWKEYTALPNRGASVELTGPVNSGLDFSIDCEVILPLNRKFLKAWIQEAKVQAELVIFLPLEFVAQNELGHVHGGAGVDLDLFEFMGNFDGDFFGRESADSKASITSYFETMSLIIEFSENVFNGAILYIDSNDSLIPLSFSQKITGTNLEIKFDEKTMEKINEPDYFPFVPNYIIHFDSGDILSLPPNFHSNYIRLEAKLKANIDLPGNNK